MGIQLLLGYLYLALFCCSRNILLYHSDSTGKNLGLPVKEGRHHIASLFRTGDSSLVPQMNRAGATFDSKTGKDKVVPSFLSLLPLLLLRMNFHSLVNHLNICLVLYF